MEASEPSGQAWWASIDHRRPAVLFLIALAGSYGMLFASMLPALVNTWLVHLKLTEQVAGFIATANILAATVGLALSIVLVSRWPLVRIARAGIAIAAAGDIASIFAASAIELGVLRLLAGFGLGLLAGAMTNWFGRHEHAERGFGISVMLQFVLTALLFALIPVIEPWFGDASIYVALLTLGLAAILLSPLFNLNGGFAPLVAPVEQADVASDRRSLGLMVLAVLAFALFELAVVGLWSYMLRYAELSGLSSASAARVLALSSLCGIPGTVLVLVFGSRYGRWRPLLVSLALYVLPTLVLALSSASSALLIFGLVLQNIAWAIAVPYFQAVQACLDRSGRLAIWGMLAASVGAGFGPALLGAAIDGGSFAMAFGAAVLMLAVSAMIVARPAIVADRIEP